MKQGIRCPCQNTLWLILSTARDKASATRGTQACGRGGSFTLWEWPHLAGVHMHPFTWSLKTHWRPASSGNGSPGRRTVSLTWALPPAAGAVGVEWGLCILVVQWSTARFGATPVHTGCHWWEEVCTQRDVIFSKFLSHPSSRPSILLLPSYWLPGPF